MEKLIEFFKANRGTQLRLAKRLGLQPSTVSQWKSVPPEHALTVEDFTGISRHELRPDVFGPQPEQARATA
jgi:DNA-binding transcriptional regulator YdaS (Cro superfamily)